MSTDRRHNNINHNQERIFVMKRTLMLVISLSLLGFTKGGAQDHQHHDMQTHQSGEEATEMYSCPMHSEVVSDKPGKCPKCGMTLVKRTAKEETSLSEMMGKPTFEKSVEGVNVQVWLMTQAEHKKMMKDHGMMGDEKKDRHEMMGMHGNMAMGKDHHMMKGQTQHDTNEMNEEAMKSMLAGTHHVMVIVQDETSKTERESVDVEVQIVSPTERHSNVVLTRMMKDYGGGLTLDENGEYGITVEVRDGERVVPLSFEYDVKPTDE